MAHGYRAAPGGDRRLAMVFGILGSLLIILDGLLRAIGGAIGAAFGHGQSALAAWDQAFLLVAVGVISGFLSLYGRSGPRDQGVGVGAVLIVLAVIGWFALGLGNGLLALLGTVLVLIGGILFLASAR